AGAWAAREPCTGTGITGAGVFGRPSSSSLAPLTNIRRSFAEAAYHSAGIGRYKATDKDVTVRRRGVEIFSQNPPAARTAGRRGSYSGWRPVRRRVGGPIHPE